MLGFNIIRLMVKRS